MLIVMSQDGTKSMNFNGFYVAPRLTYSDNGVQEDSVECDVYGICSDKTFLIGCYRDMPSATKVIERLHNHRKDGCWTFKMPE